MKEQSNLSAPGNAAPKHESATTDDSIELIESEMDALRLRMKRLENRMERLTGLSETVPLSAAPNLRNPSSSESQRNNILTAARSHQTGNDTTPRRPKQTSGTKTRRTSRKPRKPRSSKIKRNLLLGYGLLIGAGVMSVFVLMILNLFNAEIFLPNPASTPTVEMEINDTPDLEELRMSIEDEAQ